ncbi:MAG: Triosephosphate isomerase [Parcubacteria group bacterium GW2011_GWA2_38_27]|nr:MAG: Triosephosphate isomerase [Parcubacteria group bacterium GW2011_GWA2_38_27]
MCLLVCLSGRHTSNNLARSMKNLIVANWKCNPTTLKEAKQLFDSIKKSAKNIKKSEVVLCPPFVFLKELSFFKKGSLVFFKLGAQNCFWEKFGAYTGEISLPMLRDLGCEYVIVGHSERRKYFGETNEIVNKKLKAIIDAKLTAILCVGETQEQRNNGETEKVLKEQIIKAIKNISCSKFHVSNVCIAYEPVWAIGTNNPCDHEEAQKMGLLIRKIISEIYSRPVSQKFRLIYGGSVKGDNAAGYIKEAGLNGLLVGGASLDPKEFLGTIKSIE